MDTIILDLLKENGRVIIPDFGALIVKQKSPFTVIFNEFLQYNDGALIGAVSLKQSVDRDEAANKTREFTKDLQTRLGNGEEVSLKGIGVLVKSGTGKISIKEGDSEKTETKTPVTKKPTPAKSEEVKTVEFDLDEKKEKTTPPPKKQSTPSTTKKELPKQPIKATTKKELPKSTPKKTIAQPAAKKEMPKSVPEKKEESVKNTETPPINEYYTEENGKNKKNIILWIAIIVIVNGAIIGFFLFSDEIKSFIGKKNESIETTVQEVIPEPDTITTAIDTSTQEEPTEAVIEDPIEVEEQEVAQEMFAGTKYFVVAGVFGVEANADKLVTDLRKKGYNSEKFGKIGNMYAVSYDVFPTKREADRLMLKIQREVDAGAWIKIID